MMIVICGLPGFLWKVPPFQNALTANHIVQYMMRLGQFGDKVDPKQPKPRMAFLQLVTNGHMPFRLMWPCPCRIPISEHFFDWYGRHPDQAEWRKKVSEKYCKEVANTLKLKSFSTIVDYVVPPLPIEPSKAVFATDARQ